MYVLTLTEKEWKPYLANMLNMQQKYKLITQFHEMQILHFAT